MSEDDSESKRKVRETYDDSSLGKSAKYQSTIQRRWYEGVFNYFVREALIDTEEGREGRVRILDVGTGAGLFPALLRDEHRDIVGIDLSRDAVRVADSLVEGAGCTFGLADGERLPFTDASFDFALAMGTFEYLEDISPLVSEISRVLRPGGGLVTQIHNARDFQLRSWKERHDYARHAHTIESIEERFRECGLEIVNTETTHFVLEFQKLLFQSSRVPRILRRGAVTASVLGNRLCQRIPYVNERGGTHLTYGRKHLRRPTDDVTRS